MDTNDFPKIFETPYGLMARREARQILSEAQNHRCCYCGIIVIEPPWPGREFEFFPEMASIEHIVPLSRGGDHSWNNLAVACIVCNNSRCAWDMQELHAVAFYYERLKVTVKRPGVNGKKLRRITGLKQVATPHLPKCEAMLDFARMRSQTPHPMGPRYVPLSKSPLNMSRKAAKLAHKKLYAECGPDRLPKIVSPVMPLEGANLGSIWPNNRRQTAK